MPVEAGEEIDSVFRELRNVRTNVDSMSGSKRKHDYRGRAFRRCHRLVGMAILLCSDYEQEKKDMVRVEDTCAG